MARSHSFPSRSRAPRRGLVHPEADRRKKPAAKAYRSHAIHQWRTRAQGKAGENGKVSARGFLGDYVVTVEKDGRHAEAMFSVGPDVPKQIVAITRP